MEKTPQIFISYSHRDQEWIKAFTNSLKNQGISSWVDLEKIHLGASVEEAVEQGLRESDLIVALVNSDNLKSPWFLFELGAAFGMKKKLVAIVPEDIDLALVPLPLKRRRYLIKHSPENTAKELVESGILN